MPTSRVRDVDGKFRSTRKAKVRCCDECGTSVTCQWRTGVDGSQLCNACGIRERRRLEAAAEAGPPQPVHPPRNTLSTKPRGSSSRARSVLNREQLSLISRPRPPVTLAPNGSRQGTSALLPRTGATPPRNGSFGVNGSRSSSQRRAHSKKKLHSHHRADIVPNCAVQPLPPITDLLPMEDEKGRRKVHSIQSLLN